MTDPVPPRVDLLSSMLLELIEILRDRQGDTWDKIVRIAANQSATIAIDNTRIYIEIEGEQNLQIKISVPEPDAVNSFESTGLALRKIMFGQTTLEKSVASGKIFVRAGFADLLKIRAIVTAVLQDTEIDYRLQNLWKKFDREW